MHLVIDTETSAAPNIFPWIPNSYLCMVGIYTSEGKHYSWVFNHNHCGIKPHTKMIKEIQDIVDSADFCIAHNFKFDLHWLNTIGIKFKTIYDTMIIEYLLNGQNNRLSYSLDESCKRRGLETKFDVVKSYWDSGIDTCDIPLEILEPYCIQDCKVTLQLHDVQQSVIPPSMRTLVKLQNAFVECLFEIESNGMVVDMPYLQEQTAIYTKLKESLDERLAYFIVDNVPELNNIPYSLGSGDHLSAILFGGIIKYDSTEWVTRTYVKAPPRTYERNCVREIQIKGLEFTPIKGSETKKDGYYKTNKDILNSLKGKTKVTSEFINIIRQQSDINKILGTYLKGIANLIPEGSTTVHPPFNQALTVTGRLSSFFQTLPRGATKETAVVKRMFVTRKD